MYKNAINQRVKLVFTISTIKQNYCFIATSTTPLEAKGTELIEMLKIWDEAVTYLATVPDAAIKEKTKAIVQKNFGLNLLKRLIEKDWSVLNVELSQDMLPQDLCHC